MSTARRKIQKRENKPRRALPDLPVYYYHTNFCQMLRFVRDRYSGVMGKAHLEFMSDFFSLSHKAQCLYVRMAGRKVDVFDLPRLSYPEIGRLPHIAQELINAGFAHAAGENHMAELLEIVTRPELISWLERTRPKVKFKKSAKKCELMEIASLHLAFDKLNQSDRFLVQGRRDALSFISFLYFGKIEENMQRFTMRDLGLIQVPDFKREYAARFHEFDEAWSAYFYARALRDYEDDEAAAALMDTLDDWPHPQCEADASARDQLCFHLGKICERQEDPDMALIIYGNGDGPKSREREVRLRYKLGDKDWAEKRLEAMIDHPVSDSEYDFAVDFYSRKFGKKRTSQMTDILRAGLEIPVDEALKHLPEYGAGRVFEREGFEVYRSENGLWRMLFGLLFWDELFNSKKSALHNAFDRRPSSLKNGTFYTDFKGKIEKKLVRLSDKKSTQLSLLKSFSTAYGKPNGIFQWSRDDFDMVTALIETADPAGLSEIMRRMTQNYMEMKDGFPDLMRIWDGALSFIEVKAPGDVIRRNQLTRIRQLREAGFDVQIAKIRWDVDPDQTYVVVDIETTGGGGRAHHRITEIGALKVKGGKVIGEFQTLLNPERHVPAFITRLTGISNDMVKDAPVFEKIADDFKAFLEGSIFVAHNVKFDYGFIREEYGRLGRPFSYPKICTVASMRRYYPGLKSYSLANLCKEFSIDLNGHHRAMVDARAATELLFLINDKRCDKRCEK